MDTRQNEMKSGWGRDHSLDAKKTQNLWDLGDNEKVKL